MSLRPTWDLAALLPADALLNAGTTDALADVDERLFLAAVFFAPVRLGPAEPGDADSSAREKASSMTASACSKVSWRVSIITCTEAPEYLRASGPKLQLQRRNYELRQG